MFKMKKKNRQSLRTADRSENLKVWNSSVLLYLLITIYTHHYCYILIVTTIIGKIVKKLHVDTILTMCQCIFNKFNQNTISITYHVSEVISQIGTAWRWREHIRFS